jgi:abortive infection bacteriophage resistance protein
MNVEEIVEAYLGRSMNVEEVVEAYLNIRNARDSLLKQYEKEDTELKSDLSQLEAILLSACNEVNANSINTECGTVIRKLNERFFCNDWDGFKQFVKENDALDLFERRIHQGNFKQFMAGKEDGLPPGVNVMREFGISVRKPSKD